MGLACGNIVLTVAVIAIVITAPLGAFMIEHTYKNFYLKLKIMKCFQRIINMLLIL